MTDAIPSSFPAVFVAEPHGTPASLRAAGEADLGTGDVVVEVCCSSLNYKDGLAISGTAPIARSHPMIGGVDLAGRVVASDHDGIAPGARVAVVGSGLSEEHPGGYAAYARVPGEWCLPIPDGRSFRDAMAIGTAGMTAMLSYGALARNLTGPDDVGDAPVVVTGASGGVGSFSVLVGSRLGYHVVASTGRTHEAPYLGSLGAAEVIDRSELAEMAAGALARARYAGGVDTVGGTTLANLVRSIVPGGTVAACGLAQSADLPLTVYPFILRGVTLAGVNSVKPRVAERDAAWSRLFEVVTEDDVDAIATTTALDDIVEVAPTILSGAVRGRVVVVVNEGLLGLLR